MELTTEEINRLVKYIKVVVRVVDNGQPQQRDNHNLPHQLSLSGYLSLLFYLFYVSLLCISFIYLFLLERNAAHTNKILELQQKIKDMEHKGIYILINIIKEILEKEIDKLILEK